MNKAGLLGIAGTVVVAGTAGAYLLLDKSPKEKYFDLEKEALVSFEEDFNKKYGELLKLENKMFTEPTKYKGEFSIDLEPTDKVYEFVEENLGLGLENSHYKAVIDKFNDNSIKVNAETDFKNSKLNLGLSLNEKDKTVISGDLHVNGNEVVLNSKEILDKALVLDKEFLSESEFDLKALFKLISENDTELTKEQRELISKYYTAFVDSIPEEKVTSTKVELDGKKYEKLTLKLNGTSLKTSLKEVLKEAKEDKELLEVLTELELRETLLIQQVNGVKVTEEDKKEFRKEFKESYAEGIDDLIKELDDSLDSDFSLVSSITVDKKEIVGREFSIESGYDKVVFKDKKSKNGGLSKFTVNSEDKLVFELENKYTTINKDKTEKTVNKFSVTTNGISLKDFLTLEYAFKVDKKVSTTTVKLIPSISVPDYELKDFDLTFTYVSDLSKKAPKYDISFVLNSKDYGKVIVKLIQDTEFVKEVKPFKATKDNSLNVNSEKDQEEIGKMFLNAPVKLSTIFEDYLSDETLLEVYEAVLELYASEESYYDEFDEDYYDYEDEEDY